MTREELLEILAEQFSCDAQDLEGGTTLEELGADHEDLVELAWQLGEAAGVEIDKVLMVGAQLLERCAALQVLRVAAEQIGRAHV